MEIITVKPFRPGTERGVIVQPGTRMSVTDETGQSLINDGVAVRNTNALKEHEHKMQAEFQNKGLLTDKQKDKDEEARSSGIAPLGPETAEIRSGGVNNAPEKPTGQPEPAIAQRLAAFNLTLEAQKAKARPPAQTTFVQPEKPHVADIDRPRPPQPARMDKK